MFAVHLPRYSSSGTPRTVPVYSSKKSKSKPVTKTQDIHTGEGSKKRTLSDKLPETEIKVDSRLTTVEEEATDSTLLKIAGQMDETKLGVV